RQRCPAAVATRSQSQTTRSRKAISLPSPWLGRSEPASKKLSRAAASRYAQRASSTSASSGSTLSSRSASSRTATSLAVSRRSSAMVRSVHLKQSPGKIPYLGGYLRQGNNPRMWRRAQDLLNEQVERPV